MFCVCGPFQPAGAEGNLSYESASDNAAKSPSDQPNCRCANRLEGPDERPDLDQRVASLRATR